MKKIIIRKRKYIIMLLSLFCLLILLFIGDYCNLATIYNFDCKHSDAYISAIVTGLITFGAMWFIDEQNYDRNQNSEYYKLISTKKIEIIKKMLQIQSSLCYIRNELIENNYIKNLKVFKKELYKVINCEKALGCETQFLCMIGYLDEAYMDLTFGVFVDLSPNFKLLIKGLNHIKHNSVELSKDMLDANIQFVLDDTLEKYFSEKMNLIISAVSDFDFKDKFNNQKL